MTEKEIKKIVSDTVDDLLEKKQIVQNGELTYRFMALRLQKHFNCCHNEKIDTAMQTIINDPYFKTIPMFYRDNMTITAIAVTLECDRATVTRNKKRLVLDLYNKCYEN